MVHVFVLATYSTASAAVYHQVAGTKIENTVPMLRKVYSAETATPARPAAFCWLVAQVRALLRPQARMRGLFPNKKLLVAHIRTERYSAPGSSPFCLWSEIEQTKKKADSGRLLP